MNRVFLNVLTAALLVAALSTRCVFACFIQNHSLAPAAQSDLHACCHKGTTHTRSAQSEWCDGPSFVVEKPAAHIAPFQFLHTFVALPSPPRISYAKAAYDIFGYSPPDFAALHEILLI